MGRERAYGIVTRKDVTTKMRRGSDGWVRSYDDMTTREERSPVVRKATRYNYRCNMCGAGRE